MQMLGASTPTGYTIPTDKQAWEGWRRISTSSSAANTVWGRFFGAMLARVKRAAQTTIETATSMSKTDYLKVAAALITIAGIVYAAYQPSGYVSGMLAGAWETIKGLANTTWSSITTLDPSALTEWIGQKFSSMVNALLSLKDTITNTLSVDSMLEMASKIGDVIGSLYESLGDAAGWLVDTLKAFTPQCLWDGNCKLTDIPYAGNVLVLLINLLAGIFNRIKGLVGLGAKPDIPPVYGFPGAGPLPEATYAYPGAGPLPLPTQPPAGAGTQGFFRPAA